MLIHAEFEPSYYGLESEDLKHIADDLFKRGIQLYIHTDHADSCPNDGAFVLLKGNYSDSIRSVMLSGDNLSDDIYQMMNLYAERLSDAAVRSMSYSNREHKMLMSQLERLKDHHSLLEVFYALMQAAELFFHYTALCILTEENSVRQMPKELSLGTMMNIISEKAGRFSPQLYNIKENRRNEFDSVIRDYTEASKFFRSTINLKVSSKQFTGRHAAELTVQIRNRYLGHGTLTYSISEEFLAAFIPMVSAAIAECINMSSAISSSGILSITNLANTDIPAAAERDNSIYLFSRTFTDSVGAEYIDPVSGSFYRTAEPERVSLLWNENVLNKFEREAE